MYRSQPFASLFTFNFPTGEPEPSKPQAPAKAQPPPPPQQQQAPPVPAPKPAAATAPAAAPAPTPTPTPAPAAKAAPAKKPAPVVAESAPERSPTLARAPFSQVPAERVPAVAAGGKAPAMEPMAIVTGSKPPKTLMMLRAKPPASAAIVDGDTDLVPGVYEGGLKVWECSIDLVEYMMDNPGVYGPEALAGKRVLELGCGHGLPGIYTLKNGAHAVFTDYNRQVLENATMPNIRANAPEALPASENGAAPANGAFKQRAEFYCGDWASLPEVFEEAKVQPFDIILTAETLYTATATVQVCRLLEALLAPGGHALVAAKRYYFGCGGSTSHFRQLIVPPLKCDTVEVIDTGVANIREIIRVSYIDAEETARLARQQEEEEDSLE